MDTVKGMRPPISHIRKVKKAKWIWRIKKEDIFSGGQVRNLGGNIWRVKRSVDTVNDLQDTIPMLTRDARHLPAGPDAPAPMHAHV